MTILLLTKKVLVLVIVPLPVMDGKGFCSFFCSFTLLLRLGV